MLFTLSTTHQPATDLGFLLHKHPDQLHTFETSQGLAWMFYTKANHERCTFALMLELDPVKLVRGSGQKGDSGLLAEYVNDRPYAVSSFLTVALGRGLGTAFTGRSKERQTLADTALPFEVKLTPLPVRGAEDLPARLFEPLGYEVTVDRHALLPEQAAWGESPYVTLTLKTKQRLQAVLEHIFVLIPVLDNRKHYFIDKAELEKLLRKGEAWLADHPEKTLIAERYLKHRKVLVQEALARLSDDEPVESETLVPVDLKQNLAEFELEKPLRLNEIRLDTVANLLLEQGAERVLDLGCGEGRLLKRLLQEKQFKRIVGVDVSLRALEIAARRVNFDAMSAKQRERVELWQGALTYRDKRFASFDAIALVEVIEHLEPDRLAALERVLFEFARPKVLVLTTPNREFNLRFPHLANGKLRHADHRFEWTRAEFQAWCQRVAEQFGYQVSISGLGEADAELGYVTQVGVFTL
jgi:3' terminal RNA ribose 2'-O-methyltransferase Hen1